MTQGQVHPKNPVEIYQHGRSPFGVGTIKLQCSEKKSRCLHAECLWINESREVSAAGCRLLVCVSVGSSDLWRVGTGL